MIPGFVFDGIYGQVDKSEAAMPLTMKEALQAVKITLKTSGIDADIIEPTKIDCYISFSKGELSGRLHIIKNTERLVTVEAEVKSDLVRAEAIEKSLLETMKKTTNLLHETDGATLSILDMNEYLYAQNKPAKDGTVIAMVRKGADVEVKEHRSNWLKVKMPSGNYGWIRGQGRKH